MKAVAVILFLAASLTCSFHPPGFHAGSKGKVRATHQQIANFAAALEAFNADTGRYPSSAQALEALRRDPGVPGWGGPYLSRSIPKDPWANDYQYRYPGHHGSKPDLVSLGADGFPGGGEGDNADITSWSKE